MIYATKSLIGIFDDRLRHFEVELMHLAMGVGIGLLTVYNAFAHIQR